LDPVARTEHEVRLSGLTPDTKYFYSIGSSALRLAGGPDCYFVTPPTNTRPTRIWAIGDSGTADIHAITVRQIYQTYAGAREADVWLMLGDNAY
jgi:phosphodiesterase/alkaline phosphatase D-like protein